MIHPKLYNTNTGSDNDSNRADQEIRGCNERGNEHTHPLWSCLYFLPVARLTVPSRPRGPVHHVLLTESAIPEVVSRGRVPFDTRKTKVSVKFHLNSSTSMKSMKKSYIGFTI